MLPGPVAPCTLLQIVRSGPSPSERARSRPLSGWDSRRWRRILWLMKSVRLGIRRATQFGPRCDT